MIKKILSVIVFCAVLISSVLVAKHGRAEEAILENSAANRSAFGFEVIREIYREGENIVFSPMSLEIALSMAADGADGDTLSEILTAMQCASTDEILADISSYVHSANAAFTSEKMEVRQDYIERLNDAYGAEWFAIDENVLENANDWAHQNTNGLIDPLLTQELDADTGLILINAVAMDADWQSPFYESEVEKDVFHAASGDIEVDMMHRDAYMDYIERDGVQIVRLPYANSELAMYVMLPQEGGMQALLDALCEQGSDYFAAEMGRRKVMLGLPKLDVSDENSLNAALNALGIEKAFGMEADFSGISETPLYISDIFQKARISIDEAGTQAAATTVVVMPMMAVAPSDDEPAEMLVNRPFAFAIVDEACGSVCFAGVIEAPQMDV